MPSLGQAEQCAHSAAGDFTESTAAPAPASGRLRVATQAREAGPDATSQAWSSPGGFAVDLRPVSSSSNRVEKPQVSRASGACCLPAHNLTVSLAAALAKPAKPASG
jgi:hypothetical protein